MRIILNIKQIILWFISYMMIVSIAFIFGGILYLRSSNIIEQEITSTNISMLKQIQDSVELKLEEIKQISFQLKRDKDSQDFSYYMGKLNNTQIYRISNQIQKLSVYVTANKAMKQLSIYYPRINAVINAQSKYDPSLFYSNELELFWDNVEAWEKEIRSMPASTMIKGETQCKSEGFLTELLLIEALTSHGNSVNKIMIRLDPDVILDILSSAYRDSEAAVYIMDGSGQILFSNTIEQFDERVDAIRSGESTVVLSDEKSYIISGISSSENDWKYFMLTPKEIYMGQLGKMNSFALKLAVFVGFACILMAILLAYFQYRPVRRILNLIESLDGEHTQFSVFPYIQNALQKAQRDNAQIRERLSMQAVYNGKVNLSNYMTQTYSDIPILDVLEQYDMVMDKKYFTVVSFFFRGECTVIPTYDVKMELPLTVEKFIHTHMNHVKAYFFNTPQSLCGCINYDDAETDLKKIISQLYHELSDGGEIGLLAAISGTAETVYDLPNAYTQTLYINQNTAPSETGVFLYSQLDMQKYQFKSLSTDFCDSVTNSLLIADRENLFRLLDQAFADSQNWPAYLIKPLKIQIQSAFLTAVTTVNERLKINLADFSNQLTELNLQENTNDFIKRIKSIIDNVCQFLPAQTVLISSGIETRAKEIVHTHNAAAEDAGEADTGEGKEERITLTFWTGLGNKISEQFTSWDEIAAWSYIEEKFNVDIEFIHPAYGQEAESFNLLLTSKELPDIINADWRTFQGGGAAKAISEGIIMDLTDLMPEYAPNLLNHLEENPQLRREATTDEGQYYYFPYMYPTRLANSFVGFQIRQDWLDKLGLEMPETIDDWHTVLTAFKTQDPNGNGEADEVPFVPSKSHNPIASLSSLAYFRMAFGLSAHFDSFYLDSDKKVQYSYLQPAYRDYLETMRQWYEEGLIDPEFITNDNKVLTAKMTSNEVGATFAGYGMGFLGNWTNVMQNEKGEEDFFLVGTPYPSLDGGEPNGYSDPFVSNGGAAISTSCKNVERAMEVLDYLYSPEGHLVINFGPDETVYTMVDGKAQYKQEEIMQQNPGLPVDSVLIRYGMACQGGPFIQDVAYSEMVASTFPAQTVSAENYIASNIDWIIPPVSATVEEASELSTIVTDANTMMSEFETKVIMGIEPIENLDKMIDALKAINIDRAIEIKQACVDRYYNR